MADLVKFTRGKKSKQESSEKMDTETFLDFYYQAINKGETIKELAVKLNRSEKTVRRWCEKTGVSTNPLLTIKRYNISNDEFIQLHKKALQQGKTYTYIAAKLGCSKDYARQKAVELGLKKLATPGGKRPGAGRKKGSKNVKTTDPVKWWLEEMQRLGDRVTNYEVGIKEHILTSKDFRNFAGSVYNKEGKLTNDSYKKLKLPKNL